MSSAGLDKYYEVLLENEVTDIPSLLDLSPDDIKEMGFAIGAKNKLLAKIKALKESQAGIIVNNGAQGGLLDKTNSFAASNTQS